MPPGTLTTPVGLDPDTICRVTINGTAYIRLISLQTQRIHIGHVFVRLRQFVIKETIAVLDSTTRSVSIDRMIKDTLFLDIKGSGKVQLTIEHDSNTSVYMVRIPKIRMNNVTGLQKPDVPRSLFKRKACRTHLPASKRPRGAEREDLGLSRNFFENSGAWPSKPKHEIPEDYEGMAHNPNCNNNGNKGQNLFQPKLSPPSDKSGNVTPLTFVLRERYNSFKTIHLVHESLDMNPVTWVEKWDDPQDLMAYLRGLINRATSIEIWVEKAESGRLLSETLNVSEIFHPDMFLNVLRQQTAWYGQSTLVQFQDSANQNAFRLLEKYRNRYLTFNDDIQGTASVAVAGFIASMRVTKKKLSDNLYLFQGAGEASIGIADLMVMAMMAEGVSEADAISKLWMVDSKGLLTTNRPSGKLSSHKARYVKNFKHLGQLEEICRELRPSVAIGAAAVGGAFTDQFIRDMGQFNERPVIFALSTPTSKAECTAEQAYRLTEGRCIFASGSPFDPVEVNGKRFYPGQGNNAYIFPGVALAAILSKTHHITDGMFLKASQALAEMVTEDHLNEGRVYPPLSTIREVSARLATHIVEHNYEKGLATFYPEPADKRAFVEEYQYQCDYDNFVPSIYVWPGMTE